MAKFQFQYAESQYAITQMQKPLSFWLSKLASEGEGSSGLLSSLQVLILSQRAVPAKTGSLELLQRPLEEWHSQPLVEHRVTAPIVRCVQKLRVPQPNGYVRGVVGYPPPPSREAVLVMVKGWGGGNVRQ